MNRLCSGLARVATVAGAVLLGGCAAMSSITSDVSTFGEWPAGRAPGTYAFDRLPSQQVQAGQEPPIEAMVRPALEKAGFKPAAAGQAPDVLVQVGASVSRLVRSPWDDPFWWRGFHSYGRVGPWVGPRRTLVYTVDFPRYDREVAVLIRDGSSGKPLFEARAGSEGATRADPAVLGAMFTAALSEFPKLGANPRPVTVQTAN